MKHFLRLLGLTAALASATSAQAKTLAMTIQAPGYGPVLQVFCEDASCDTVSFSRLWIQQEDMHFGPVSLERVREHLDSQPYRRIFTLPDFRESLRYEETADRLNLLLPVIWLVGGAACLAIDAAELCSSPNRHTRWYIAHLSAQLKKPGPHVVSIPTKTMERLHEVYERALRDNDRCDGRLAQAVLAP